jgi:hypothetical protein
MGQYHPSRRNPNRHSIKNLTPRASHKKQFLLPYSCASPAESLTVLEYFQPKRIASTYSA